MTSASTEEYLEAIYRLTEKREKVTTTNISRLLSVAPASVTEMLRRLEKEGYLKHEPYGDITLTGKGAGVGKKIVKRHRIIERFLQMLGLQKNKLHEEACRLEHAVSDDVERALDSGLGFPEKSPTGMPIPRGDCKSLVELKAGGRGVVVGITGGRNVVQRLSDMGLTPGSEVKVLKLLPQGPVEVATRGSRLALGRGVAMKITVEVRP